MYVFITAWERILQISTALELLHQYTLAVLINFFVPKVALM